MRRRVATITLNPAYDLVGFCPEIERGEVNLVKTTGRHAAGKGINVAKVLKDLGIDVTVGGFLGKDNQDGFQQLQQSHRSMHPMHGSIVSTICGASASSAPASMATSDGTFVRVGVRTRNCVRYFVPFPRR